MSEDRVDRWNGSGSDHDLLTANQGRIERLERDMRDLIEDMKALKADRAKVIGWSGGVTFAVGILVKFFWPKA